MPLRVWQREKADLFQWEINAGKICVQMHMCSLREEKQGRRSYDFGNSESDKELWKAYGFKSGEPEPNTGSVCASGTKWGREKYLDEPDCREYPAGLRKNLLRWENDGSAGEGIPQDPWVYASAAGAL